MLPAQVQCVCETIINVNKAKVFVTLSLRKQHFSQTQKFSITLRKHGEPPLMMV